MLLRRLCRHPKKWAVRYLFQAFFISVLSILILVAILAYLTSTYLSPSSSSSTSSQHLLDLDQKSNNNYSISSLHHRHLKDLKLIPFDSAPIRRVKRLDQTSIISLRKQTDESRINSELKGGWTKCSMYNCFDIHRCGTNGRQSLSVYVYPIEKLMVDERSLFGGKGISREFYEFLDAIRRSPYYVPNPEDACIFVPSIDTLNLPKTTISSSQDLEAALSSLPFWGNNGQNHLLVSMSPQETSDVYSLNSETIIASSGFHVESYRVGFHVPLISYNPLLRGYKFNSSYKSTSLRNNIVAISAQGHLPPRLIEDNNILVLDFCIHKRPINYLKRCKGRRVYEYPAVLNSTDFCIIIKDLAGPALWDVMSVGCIPVIVADLQRLPFDEVIDWKKNAIVLYEQQIPHMSSILQGVSQKRRSRLKSQIQFTFNKYFKNMHQITSTLLQVLHDRVFSHFARTLEDWNHNHQMGTQQQPLFNPVIAPKDAGFTAVILAYERVSSLFEVIERVSQVPSLAKILVVWNNQVKPPPPYSAWPKISKPLKVVQMEKNKMSNRFYPFEEIETEAVFSLDDDIIMLTVDEIEFAFDTWREFPDRIVGFPSRNHVWDNSSQRYKYESEWTNEISMVLTGAAFYHKYWHHAYTFEMSKEIREWVDDKMNCEDIAMNFLVASQIGKSPVKVTPRKKFKCPTCSNNEMLSSDSSHMVERTDCINKFVQIYGNMPLVSAEFRADPVLYKVDNLSRKLKKFNEIGSL